MHNISIITDSTTGLPKEISDKYQIPIIPQVITFGNKSYYEGIDIDNTLFMQMLKASKELPKTAAPPPELFAQQFEILTKARSTIFCIHPSAEVSGTVRSATIAAQEFPDADIRIIDTRTIGSPTATLVQISAEMASTGVDANTIEKRIRSLVPRNRVYFVVDTLVYLAKGGRIGGAAALLGSVLKIKPILALIDGKVNQFEKTRTQRHAIDRLIELVDQQASKGNDAFISVMHAAVPEIAREFSGILSAKFGQETIPILDVPPAIVVHGGPGILAVSFFTDGG